MLYIRKKGVLYIVRHLLIVFGQNGRRNEIVSVIGTTEEVKNTVDSLTIILNSLFNNLNAKIVLVPNKS